MEASDAHTITPGHYLYRRDGDSLRLKLWPPVRRRQRPPTPVNLANRRAANLHG
jgi:hypothetical protein